MPERDDRLELASLNPRLSDIPADLMAVDGDVDWNKVQAEMGVQSWEDLQRVLLYLYRYDVQANYHMNRSFLALVLRLRRGAFVPPLQLPTEEETAWVAADTYCQQCPGNEYYELLPGMPPILKCQSENRVQRYSSCLKYRENLTPLRQEK